MPRYIFRALRQLQVGDGKPRQPGELVPEAAEWPNLRHYLSLEWIEKLPAADDDQAVEYPPVNQVNTFAEALQPEGEPTPVTVAWKRKTGASVAIRCVNCRKLNHLPADFLETATWMCWDCAQPQTWMIAEGHPSPTSIEEYTQSVDARFVDDEGDLLPDRLPGGVSEDLTGSWTPGAGEAVAAGRS